MRLPARSALVFYAISWEELAAALASPGDVFEAFAEVEERPGELSAIAAEIAGRASGHGRVRLSAMEFDRYLVHLVDHLGAETGACEVTLKETAVLHNFFEHFAGRRSGLDRLYFLLADRDVAGITVPYGSFVGLGGLLLGEVRTVLARPGIDMEEPDAYEAAVIDHYDPTRGPLFANWWGELHRALLGVAEIHSDLVSLLL